MTLTLIALLLAALIVSALASAATMYLVTRGK